MPEEGQNDFGQIDFDSGLLDTRKKVNEDEEDNDTVQDATIQKEYEEGLRKYVDSLWSKYCLPKSNKTKTKNTNKKIKKSTTSQKKKSNTAIKKTSKKKKSNTKTRKGSNARTKKSKTK